MPSYRKRVRTCFPVFILGLKRLIYYDTLRKTAKISAYVLFTSGSTRTPAGVATVHGPLCNLLNWHYEQDSQQFGPLRTLQFTTLNFDVSFEEIFSTLSVGGSLVVIDDPSRRDPYLLFDSLVSHQIERLFLPSVALQQVSEVAEQKSADLLKLREIITAGEQLQVTTTVRNFCQLTGSLLRNYYGPTESHVECVIRGNSSIQDDGDREV